MITKRELGTLQAALALWELHHDIEDRYNYGHIPGDITELAPEEPLTREEIYVLGKKLEKNTEST